AYGLAVPAWALPAQTKPPPTRAAAAVATRPIRATLRRGRMERVISVPFCGSRMSWVPDAQRPARRSPAPVGGVELRSTIDGSKWVGQYMWMSVPGSQGHGEGAGNAAVQRMVTVSWKSWIASHAGPGFG